MTATAKFNGFAVGDKVLCNGYPGTVTRLCEWSNSMIEVRLNSGLVCVDAMTVKPLIDPKIMGRLWKRRNADYARAVRLAKAARG